MSSLSEVDTSLGGHGVNTTVVKVVKTLITLIALLMVFYHFYAPLFGRAGALQHRSLHLIFAYCLVFLPGVLSTLQRGNLSFKSGTKIFTDLLFIAMGLWGFGYIYLNYYYIISRITYATPLTTIEMVNGILVIILVLEASRRAIGWVLTSVGLAAILYIFFGNNLPGIFGHSGYRLQQFLETQYLTTDGLMGMPIAVSSSYIILFVVFGALLQVFGLSDLIMYLSKIVTGRTRGGPAKLAVVASGFMGMISGSSISNVASTGAITIPLMKRNGYTAEFAGAVEAAASTGGQLLPPVMGIVIFLMADFTGIPYIEIMKHAIIPGLLYFLAIGIIVHLRAVRMNLEVMDIGEEDRRMAVEMLKSKSHMVIPVILFIVLLIRGYSPIFSVVIANLSALALGMLVPSTRISIRPLVYALEDGARTASNVAASCAVAGVVVGIASLTGIGARFSYLVIDFAGGNLYLSLFFAMIASLVLGMGVPVGAAYILQVAFVIPALIAVGIDILPAHLFVVYFCAISLITPPVALTSYVAAGIAESNVMKTSIQATALGMAAYIIPYIFVFHPALLLIGDVFHIVLAVLTALAGILALAVAMEGYLVSKVGFIGRFLFLIAALLLLLPGTLSDVSGAALFLVCFLVNRASGVVKEHISESKGGMG